MIIKNKIIFSALWLFFGLFLIDQITKYIVRQFGGFYICNKGIAFGIPSPYSWAILFIAICLIVWQKEKVKALLKKELKKLPLILVLSGSFSNLFDRFYHGCVIDFIDLKFWPIFNLADIFIVLGLILLFLKK